MTFFTQLTMALTFTLTSNVDVFLVFFFFFFFVFCSWHLMRSVQKDSFSIQHSNLADERLRRNFPFNFSRLSFVVCIRSTLKLTTSSNRFTLFPSFIHGRRGAFTHDVVCAHPFFKMLILLYSNSPLFSLFLFFFFFMAISMHT